MLSQLGMKGCHKMSNEEQLASWPQEVTALLSPLRESKNHS